MRVFIHSGMIFGNIMQFSYFGISFVNFSIFERFSYLIYFVYFLDSSFDIATKKLYFRYHRQINICSGRYLKTKFFLGLL